MIAGADTYDMLGKSDYERRPRAPSPFDALIDLLPETEATDQMKPWCVETDKPVTDLTHGMQVAVMHASHAKHRRVFFIGNGGSAGIASHMALDWAKAGGFKAQCFNEAASLTAWGNDVGFDAVFAKPLELHGARGDLLFAISSSGMSADILAAATKAKDMGMTVVTLSGFSPSNRLRQMGDLNFYVPSDRYGLVEVAHHAVLHAILDEVMARGAGT